MFVTAGDTNLDFNLFSSTLFVFLYYPESLVGMNTRVQGLSPAGPAGLLNPIEAIYLQE